MDMAGDLLGAIESLVVDAVGVGALDGGPEGAFEKTDGVNEGCPCCKASQNVAFANGVHVKVQAPFSKHVDPGFSTTNRSPGFGQMAPVM